MADLLRISILGQMPSGEEWSVNPVFGLQDFGTAVTPVQIAAVAAAVAAVNPTTNLTNFNVAAVTLSGCRVEARKRTGELEVQAESIRATPVPGTGAAPHSFQSSWVTSLRTAQVGGTGRGRLYWPATGQSVSNLTLRPTPAVVTGALTAVASYLTGVRSAVRATFPNAYLAVWSRKNSGLAMVDSLQMGDVLDVQRRRRDSLVEGYSAAAFPN